MSTLPTQAGSGPHTHAGLVRLDVSAAAEYVRALRDIPVDNREQIVDLLEQHARQVERATERFLKFAVDTIGCVKR